MIRDMRSKFISLHRILSRRVKQYTQGMRAREKERKKEKIKTGKSSEYEGGAPKEIRLR